MYIRSIHIFGFGRYHDFSQDFRPGLNVIEGSNEAGKSTLLSFIRAMFFGFESRRLPEARYEPLEGGKFGGSIVLADKNGNEYLVERIGHRKSQGIVRVIMPDGSEHGEEMLANLLMGMSPSFYANIFAFGLTELAQLTNLTQEEVAGYLYNAGTNLSLPSLKKSWNEEMEQLFKPRGSQPSLNQRLSKIEEVHQQIRRLQQENETYNDLLEKRNELDQKVRDLETKINQIRIEQKKWEKSREAYPLYEELLFFLERLQELPRVASFPENGVSRLEELDNQIRGLSVEYESEQEKLEMERQALAALPIQPAILGAKEEIRLVGKEGERWLEKQETLSSLQRQVSFMNYEVNGYLQQLGPEWTEDILCKLDTSISKKEILRDQRQSFHRINTGLQTVQEMLQTKAAEREDCKKQLYQVGLRFQQMETIEELEQREKDLSFYQKLHKEIELEQNQKDWFDIQLGIHQPQTTHGLNGFALLLFILGIGGSALLTRLYGFSWGAGVPFLVGIIAMLAVYWMRAKGKQGGDPKNEQLKRKIRDLEISIKDKKKKCKNIDFSQLQQQLDQIRHHREAALKWGEKQAWLEEQGNQLEKEWKKLLYRKESLLDQKKEEEDRWNALLKDLRMPAGLSPEGALDMLALASKGKEVVEKVALETEKIRTLEKDFEFFSQKIHGIYERVQVTKKSDDIWILLKNLLEILEEQVGHSHDKSERERNIWQLEESLSKKNRLINKLKNERIALFKHVDVEDSESFRIVHRQYLERKEIEEKIRMIKITLKTADVDEEVMSIMDQSTHESIQLRCEYWADEWTNTQAELQELLDHRGQYKNRLQQLETGGDLSRLNQQLQELLAEAQTEAKRWIVLRMAKQLIDRTQETYEAKKQPGVLKEASAYFAQMTGDKYRRVFSPLGEERLIVERTDGMRLEPGYLSRGTREQLFLSLRLGLIKECSKDGALPILLDDIFVNFDEQRRKAAMECLGKITPIHQILYFTCRTQTAELMNSLALPYYHVDLSNLLRI